MLQIQYYEDHLVYEGMRFFCNGLGYKNDRSWDSCISNKKIIWGGGGDMDTEKFKKKPIGQTKKIGCIIFFHLSQTFAALKFVTISKSASFFWCLWAASHVVSMTLKIAMI